MAFDRMQVDARVRVRVYVSGYPKFLQGSLDKVDYDTQRALVRGNAFLEWYPFSQIIVDEEEDQTTDNKEEILEEEDSIGFVSDEWANANRRLEEEKERQMKRQKEQLILVEWQGTDKKDPDTLIHQSAIIGRKELQEFVLKLHREGVDPETMHYWENKRDIILEVKPKDNGPVMR